MTHAWYACPSGGTIRASGAAEAESNRPSNSEHMADTAQSAPISEKQAQSRRADRNAQAEGRNRRIGQ
ncbi:hypothetical protein DVH05_021023, partial [Phytophthora capsici]